MSVHMKRHISSSSQPGTSRRRRIRRNVSVAPDLRKPVQLHISLLIADTSMQKGWEEDDLERFLASRLPSELHPDLHVARPLLYRCMARMSSYPYLDDPEPPQALTIDDMLAALSILLLRPSWLGRPDPMATVDATVAEKHARKFRALLFRSMRLSPPQHLVDKEGRGETTTCHRRTEQDDEDLRQVHLLLTRSRRYHSERWPTKLKPGPPIIAIQDLPSSNSTGLQGVVPRDEFEAFFRICSCLGSGSREVARGINSSHLSREVDWEQFNAMIASAPMIRVDSLPMHLISEVGNQSCFTRGITLLFSLLISPAEIADTVEEHESSKEQVA